MKIVAPEQCDTRICQWSGCQSVLTRYQRKYCSGACRNHVIAIGNHGGPREKYRPEYADTVIDAYLNDCEKKNDPTLIPTARSFILLRNAHIPTIHEYAHSLGVTPQTLGNWAARHGEFAGALERLKSHQKTMVINYGLCGRYNATIAILLLKANHGYGSRHQTSGGSLASFSASTTAS